MMRRSRDLNGNVLYYNSQTGEGIMDMASKMFSAITGKTAQKLALNAAEKALNKAGEKAGEKLVDVGTKKIEKMMTKKTKTSEDKTVKTQENKGDEIIRALKKAQEPPSINKFDALSREFNTLIS